MTDIYIDLNPVDYITIDAIGKPGKRVFYLQGRQGDEIITLLMEKAQVETLSVSVEQMLVEIHEKYTDLENAVADYDEEDMQVISPMDPLFRIGELGLSFNPEKDLLILYAREMPFLDEDVEENESRVVRYYCSRSQLLALSQWGLEVANRGRSICPYCNQPMEPEGHFCPKKNGHKKH
ncbi:MAG: DUF3090 family protein [Anaerolineaceae bacterium]|nr:DUF3090 family protein [Anaerolineaceae bacterium]